MRGSFQILQFVSRNRFANLEGLDKLVLLTLASFFDSNNSCYPSLLTVAEIAGISPRKVHQSIKLMTDQNILFKGKKVGACTTYRFNESGLVLHDVQNTMHHVQNPEIEHSAPRADTSAPRADDYAPDADDYAPDADKDNTKKNTKKNTNSFPLGAAERGCVELEDFLGGKEKTELPKKLTNADKKKNDPLGEKDSGFCDFYKLWPRHLDRKAAYSAYLAKVDGNSEKHALLMRKSVEALNGVFSTRSKDTIPYPASWINSLSWADPDADLKADPFAGRNKGFRPPQNQAVQQRQNFVQQRDPGVKLLTPEEKAAAEREFDKLLGGLEI